MPVFKDEARGTWYVMVRYQDWTGERKQKCKRGFATKREAQEWERSFQMQTSGDLDMTFEAFTELYTKDMKPRLKENTWLTKENIIQKKILPYFGKRKISEITTKDVIAWQNELLAYRDEKRKPYSATYLKTLHNQLSAIFNHAVRFYELRSNPAAKAGNMGSEERKEMLFWTKAEYQKFADAMMDKPVSYYAFEMLYWCGIREGELLALTPADFDFEAGTVKISKSYQRLHGKDVITTPKTKKSNRTIKMPNFLCDEMKDYLGMLYGIKKKERIFTITKSYLHHEMDRGAKSAGVKRTIVGIVRGRRIVAVIHGNIVIHLCGVIIADGGGRIEQDGQQVLLHVADLGGVFLHTVHDKPDMFTGQLQKPGAHDLMWKVAASNPGGFPFGADGLHHQLHNLVQVLPIGVKLSTQIVILDVLQNQIPIIFYL